MNTPYTFKHVMPGRWEVIHEGKAFAVIERNTCYSSKDGIMESAELWVIIEDPDELYTIHSVVTNKGRVVYQLGETQMGDAHPYKRFRSLELDYRVGADEEFIVTLTQARKEVTVKSSDASLGEVVVATNS